NAAVTLQTNGKTYQDANAERLLQSQLGVSLPLDGMQYWVRGIPAPNTPINNVKLDPQGRPETLQQSGWQIEYNGWHGNGAQALPEKINLSRAPDNTNVKVIAKAWQTRY
ncbi:MAG: lipoprotein insertase outer membrane protein LolB, partial [Thiothrix sp.]